MTIQFTSDSTIDLSADLLAKYNIVTIPLEVHLGDGVFLDGVTVTPQKIYDYVARSGKLPKTAARNQTCYEEFFSEQLKTADHVIHYSISSGVSSSYDEADKAAKFFDGRVDVVDTLALSTGTALLAIDGALCAREGLSAADIAARGRARTASVQTSFIIDNLEYLFKGGRCSRLEVLGANVLKIKPTIEMKNGTLGVGKKFRGSLQKAAVEYVNTIFNHFNNPDLSRIFVTHTEIAPELVQEVIAAIKARFSFAEILETTAGSTITSHCGRGTIGILYLQN